MNRPTQEIQLAKWARASEIPASAAEAVRVVSEANEKRYPQEPWWWETATEQVVYAHNDVEEAYKRLSDPSLGEKSAVRNIEQAIWRLAAARYKLVTGLRDKELVDGSQD